MSQRQKEHADARARLKLAQANLDLAQSKHRLKLKASLQASGEKVSSGDLDAMVKRDTYEDGAPLNALWQLVITAEAERDTAYVIRKAIEREVYHP